MAEKESPECDAPASWASPVWEYFGFSSPQQREKHQACAPDSVTSALYIYDTISYVNPMLYGYRKISGTYLYTLQLSMRMG